MPRIATISVVVPTFNRGFQIETLLDHFKRVDVPDGISWEIIVVDNNSGDDSAEIIQSWIALNSLPVRYVFEPRQGVSFARNTGWRESTGDVIAYIDDDCYPDRAWIKAIAEEFNGDPQVSFLGGRVELFNDQDAPISIRTAKDRVVLDTAELALGMIPGCNMAYLRSALESLQGSDVTMGPGTSVYGEDIDLIYRAHKRGLIAVYSPDALVFHDHGRRTKEHVDAVNRSYLIGRGAFYMKHIMARDRYILKAAYWELSELVVNILKNRLFSRIAREEWRFMIGILTGAWRKLVYR